MSAKPGLGPRIIVVDDDRLLREQARDALEPRAQVECCDRAEAALEAMTRQPADVVISDLVMPGISGIDFLDRVRREHPGTDFIVMTGNATVESAVGALRMGAADYLTKPVAPEALGFVVERILARRRLLEENGRLRDALRTVDSCQTLIRCLDPGEVYTVTLDVLLQSLRRETGIALYRRASLFMSDAVALRGISEEAGNRLRDVLLHEKPVNLDAIDRAERTSMGPLHQTLRAVNLDLGPALAVPIRGAESESGVMWIFEGGTPFDDGDLERARLIADHADLALKNAERYDRAKERAFIDDVTEVYNARYLLSAVEHEIQRAERYGRELCVLFLDLDHFKRVNDEYGHLVGSQVLRRLSCVLRDCIRQVDTLARYGGDEFTIVMADTSLADGMVIAERIRATVADTLFESGGEAPVRLTISIGAAEFPGAAQDREGLIDLADKAMYRAKSLGRNRVCSASQLDD